MTIKTTLSDALSLAPSELFVADLKKMTDYYHKSVGLSVLASTKNSRILGHDETSVIKLVEKPKLAHASPREAGLFHNAVVFSTRGDLARAAGDTITHHPQTFSGTGDHLVSEAFYFNDPEGNGLELYYDRPRETWTWENGQVKMDTLYIDPIQFISKNASDIGDASKSLGHVHLKVGNIPQARQFYVDMLGFDITALVPGALFISIGGYHHHIALNTWMSEGASIRSQALGLGEVTISLDTEDDVSRLAVRLEQRQYPFTYVGSHLAVKDPWGNSLLFTVSVGA